MRLMHSVKTLFASAFLFIACSQTSLAAVDISGIQGQLNGIDTPTAINEANLSNLADRSRVSESIDPQSGSLNLNQTDITLPGRDGLDLSISRNYNSSQAQLGEMKSNFPTTSGSTEYYQARFYWYYVIYYKDSSGNNRRYESDRYKWNSEAVAACEIKKIVLNANNCMFIEANGGAFYDEYYNERIPRGLQYYTQYYNWISEVKPTSYLRSRYDLGAGWSFGFPSVQEVNDFFGEISSSYYYFHDGSGASYKVNFTADQTDSNLEGYDKKDVEFRYDNGTYTNGEKRSAYVFVAQDKRTTYFANDGRLLGIKDRFNNEIKFTHINRKINGVDYPFISQIVDSIGRKITFTYENTINNSTFNGENIQIDIYEPDTTRHESIIYTKYRDATDGRYEPKLWRTTLAAGTPDATNIYYEYEDRIQKFRYDGKSLTSSATIPVKVLSNVIYPNSVSSYTYEAVQRNLGNSGLYEAYRITSRVDKERRTGSGTNIWAVFAHYNSLSYMYTGDLSGYPTYTSEASIPSSYVFSSQSLVRSSTRSSGLRTKTTYNGKKQQTQVQTTASNQEQKVINYLTYDATFKYQPTRTEYIDVGKDGVSMNKMYVDQSYNSWGGLASVTQPLPLADINNAATKAKYTTTYQYNDPNYKFLTQKAWYQDTSVALSESTTYNSSGLPQTTTNANGEVTNYAYSVLGDGTKQTDITKNLENGKTGKTTILYGTEAKFAYPTTIKEFYTDRNQIVTSNTLQKSYDMLFGAEKIAKDEKGNQTTYVYDHLGRVVRTQLPIYTGVDGITYNSDMYTEYSNNTYDEGFDSSNKYLSTTKMRTYTVVSYIDPVSNQNVQKTYKDQIAYYDGFGNTVFAKKLDTDKGTWVPVSQFHYDDLARPIYVSDAFGNVNTAAYDAWGYVYENTDAFGNLYHTDRDLIARKETSFFVEQGRIDQYRAAPSNDSLKGNVLEVTLDPYGRIKSKSVYPNFPDRVTNLVSVSYDYYSDGSLKSFTDAKGYTTTYSYDKLGRLSKVTDPLQQTTAYNYNALGNLSSLQHTNGTESWTSTKTYDELARLRSSADAGGNRELFEYNSLGQLDSKKDANGVSFGYEYDQLGRQTRSGSSTSYFKTSYDANSFGPWKVEQWKDNMLVQSSSFSYTSLGQLRSYSSTSDGYTNTVAYNFDQTGRLTSVQDPFSFTTKYSLNKTRLDKVQVEGNSTATGDNDSYIKYTYYTNGALESITYPKLADGSYIKTSYTYDKIGRLLNVKNAKGSQIISQYSYAYDPNGNIISTTDETGTTTYSYDKLNRLQEVKRPGYSTIAYSYDARGNRKTLQDSSPSLIHAKENYSYDVFNQLVSVTNSVGTTSFAYNASGLRTKKTSPTETIRYTYNANGQVIAESDASNQVTSNYVWADRLLMKNDKPTDKQYYYLYNGHGDVVQIVDTVGVVQNSYQYDEWGSILGQTEKMSNSFKYAGEPMDEETGLYYLRARYYDPSLGRFINKDTYEGDITNPLSLNLYTYVHNNPLIYRDPSGHWCTSVDGRWSMPGGCDGGIEGQAKVNTSVGTSKWSPDADHEGDTIIFNGFAVPGKYATPIPSTIKVIYNPSDSSDNQPSISASVTLDYLVQIHYNRNVLNNAPQTEQGAIDAGWKKLKDSESVYHRIGFGNKNNAKYVSPSGNMEGVYDQTGILVTDPVNMGTYNFSGPDDFVGHTKYDVVPYFILGNSEDDSTSLWDKVWLTIQATVLKMSDR